LKIAIVGTAESSVHLAPFDDRSWTIWGLSGRSSLKRADLVFEMHEPALWGPGEIAALKKNEAPIVMREKHPQIENSRAYPFEAVESFFAQFGKADLWTSTIAYMLAMAVAELDRDGTIGIFGVDMLLDSEYGYQRPTLEYLIGIGRARGVEIVVPDQSALLKSRIVYGLAGAMTPKAVGITEGFLKQRLAGLQGEKDKAETELTLLKAKINTLHGAMQDCESLIAYVRHFERGGPLNG
jgi:hypothetical protein